MKEKRGRQSSPKSSNPSRETMKDRSESKTIADNAELLGEVRRTKERINNLLDIYEADKHEAELKSLSEKLSTLLENSNIPDDMV